MTKLTESESILLGLPSLSDEQREAVVHEDGPLIVLAGPGTGKTRVITARVAHMIRNRGVAPETVLAVTFTNKAAGELKERLAQLIQPAQAEAVNCATLHSFGMRLLRRFGDTLGLPHEIEILDTAQLRRMARELIRAHGLYKQVIGRGIDAAVEHGLSAAHELTSIGITPEQAIERSQKTFELLRDNQSADAKAHRAELALFQDSARLAGLMDVECLRLGAARFDDLIRWPILLLRKSSLVRDIVARDCKHIVVDEFQDLNATQIELLSLLAPPNRNPDICVVGDDDQSIYAFRGADERAFERFEQKWGGTQTLKLTTNYRSGDAVIDASNAIIEQAGYRFAPDKLGQIGPSSPSGSSIELVRLDAGDRGAATIASMISRQIEEDPDTELSDIAVIARSGTELSRVQGAFELAGIPFVSSIPDATPEDPGVLLMLDWAALLVDPTSARSARAVLTRPPFRCSAPAIGALEQRYRAACSRFEAGEEEHPAAVIPWLCDHATDELKETLERARKLEAALGASVVDKHADHALMEIIRATGAANAEELAPRDRSARVRSLVGLVRFVRERLSRIGEPRDLRAMLSYLDDLPDRDKAFKPGPEAIVEPGEQDGAGHLSGVRLLTAHASKGLEFDTVYITKVFPAWGFPTTLAKEAIVPMGVCDPDPHGRTSAERLLDEERRVFFVALTRAKKRVVLLAKLPKGNSKAVHYTLELRSAAGVDLIEHNERDVLADLDADALDALDQEGAMDRQVLFAASRRSARRGAAEALDALEKLTTPDANGLATLQRCADRLAMIAYIERHQTVPEWAEEQGLLEEASRLIDRLKTPTDDLGDRLSGRVSLSYTKINGYLRCPRCFYVREVLGMPEDSSPATSVGRAVHEALEAFVLRWMAADSEGAALPGWDDLERETRRRFFSLWPRSEEVDYGQLERAIAQSRLYWDHLHDDNAHIIEAEKKFAVPYVVDGVEHTIRGQIDRIDQCSGGGLRLIDYKTGQPKKELREPKSDDLQLGIYSIALCHEDADALAGSVGEYWLLASGERGQIPLADLKLDKIRKKIDTAVRGMLAGEFGQGTRCSGDCTFLDDVGPFDP